MKNQLGKSLTLLIVTMLLMGILPVYAGPPSESNNADAMWVEPSTTSLTTADIDHTIGYLFNVTVAVNITMATFVGAWQVKVTYNPAHLDLIDGGYTEIYNMKSNWFQPFSSFGAWPMPTGAGYVQAGETIIGAAVNETGAGTLIWLTFNVTALPPKGGSLSSSIGIDNADTFVLDETDAEITITKIDASYSFTWEAPPAPYLAVDPTLVEYGPYPPSAIGEAFDIDIYIKGLSAAWELTNASLCLCFNTTVIDVIGGIANITINPLWTGVNSVSVTHADPDRIDIFVQNPSSTPSGDVLVATIKFTVMMQEDSPPKPFGYFDSSDLYFCDVALYDHTMEIIPDSPEEGLVKIIALQALAAPSLEVDPALVILGPEPAIGTEFDINVKVTDLSEFWYMVAYQFRLTYDPTLLEVVDVTEGPFLQDPIWDLHGTFFVSFVETDGTYGPHVIAGGFLLPNSTTGDYDQTEFPHTSPIDPTLATITFRAIAQCYPVNYTSTFDIIGFWTDNEHFIDRDGFYIPTDLPGIVNGTYIMRADVLPGRMIDLYTQYPAPYGGQGAHNPSDMFWPQKEVFLYAEVTYNYWPTQQKIVSYEVEDPSGNIWLKDTAITDVNGIALLRFRIPWPCDNPEDLFGKWNVTATVDIACIVINDTLRFDFQYAVDIVSVTVDHEDLQYNHCEDVVITVEYRTKRMQPIPLLLVAVIYDDLGVPIGKAMFNATIGHDAYVFCTYVDYDGEFTIHVEKFAFAGPARVVINAFDKDPTEGGMGWCPSAETTIYIQPY